MTIFFTIITAALVFGAVVLVHELWHFLAARRCGICVEEFSIGFGPTVFCRQKNGTRYTLRLLPLGGYNMLSGMEPQTDEGEPESETDGTAVKNGPMMHCRREQDCDRRGRETVFPVVLNGKTYPEASPWQRFFVLACGALMNFLLGFILLLVLTSSESVLSTKTIYDFSEKAASHTSGLESGDEILAVNGRSCFVIEDVFYELQRTDNMTADFTVLREGRLVSVPDVRFDTVVDDAGNTTMKVDFRVYGMRRTPINVTRQSLARFAYYARSILRSFMDLFAGRVGINQLSGPVGVVSAVSQAVQYGWQDVFSLAALITINLGIFNLLPIPGLDGFKMLFLVIEGIAGREVPQKIQNAVNAAGMVLLLWLMLFITMQDIGRLF